MVLKIGSKGSNVKNLQQQLVKAGYNIKVDGIFGPETQRAVLNFQKANNLKVDGIVGPQTLSSLAKLSSSQPKSTLTKNNPITINKLSNINNDTNLSNTNLNNNPNLVLEIPNTEGIYSDILEKINSIYESQKQAELERNKIKRDNLIKDYEYQKQDVIDQIENLKNQLLLRKQQAAPEFQKLKDTQSLNSEISKKKLAEQMAQMGLTNSGDNLTLSTALENAKLKGLNDINIQERDFNNQIDLQLNEAEKEKVNRINRINDMITRLKEQGYNEDDAVIKELEARKNADVVSLLKDRIDNLYRDYGLKYQQLRDSISDNRWNEQWAYQKERDKISDSRWQKEFELSKSNSDFNKWLSQQELELRKKQLANSMNRITSSTNKTSEDAAKKQNLQSAISHLYQHLINGGNFKDWINKYGKVLEYDGIYSDVLNWYYKYYKAMQEEKLLAP